MATRASLCLLVMVLAMPAFAQLTDRFIKPDCQPTPRIGTSNYPGFKSMMPSGKLAMPPGKSVLAQGLPVYFYLRVFDKNCVPVSEAKVELWHADTQGRYRYATKAALATPDAVFAGAGRVTTDNLGQAHFLTVYPGEYSYTIRSDTGAIRIYRAPHFNVRVSHPDMNSFATNVFFTGDERNEKDNQFKRLSGGAQQRVLMKVQPRAGDWNQGVQAFIDIVLPVAGKFRSF